MELRDIFSFGIPISILFYLRFKKNNPFFLYVFIGLISETIGLISKVTINTEFITLGWIELTGLYSVFEVSTYYSYLIARASKLQKIYFGGFFISIFWTVLTVSYFDPYLYAFWPFAITSLILMLMGLFGYYEMLSDPEVSNPLKSSFFWINSAFFFYGAGSTIIFLFIDSGLREEFKVMANLWIVGFGVVNALRYIFIGIGVYQKDMIN